MPVTAIIGAQWGSEGKGCVSNFLADVVDIAIRTGAPNAGHSFVFRGKEFKMQTIPCTWTNPDCQLVLGPGALISKRILDAEVNQIREATGWDIRDRLLLDIGAGVLEDRHHEEEGGVHGDMHRDIGSTGEGVGAARRDRMARKPDNFRLVKDYPELLREYQCIDTTVYANIKLDQDKHVLLEGTQGFGLSLIHGYWPYVTSHDTTAAQLCADAGISPRLLTDIVMVARTYPIRVAGNSGPLENELSWEQMSARVGRPVLERTTVTKKVRRIGEWDPNIVLRAALLNRPTKIVLTFMDYMFPEVKDIENEADLPVNALMFIREVSAMSGCPVKMLGTGYGPEIGWRKVVLNA